MDTRTKNRKTDDAAEKIINNFMDKYYYPKLIEKGLFTGWSRVQDPVLQKKGVDVILQYDGGCVYIDEKAQARYINKNLPTQSFELSFIDRSGKLMDGWFIREDLLTDFYIIITITAEADTTIYNISESNIKSLDIIVVEKKAIKNHLLNEGVSSEELSNKSAYLRTLMDTRNPSRIIKIPSGISGINYTRSTKLPEDPVNIIIPKKVLIGLSNSNHIKITKDVMESCKD